MRDATFLALTRQILCALLMPSGAPPPSGTAVRTRGSIIAEPLVLPLGAAAVPRRPCSASPWRVISRISRLPHRPYAVLTALTRHLDDQH